LNKIALISDLHFGARRTNEHFIKSMYRFFVDAFEPYLKKNNIKTIFILGDILDHRESTNTKILNMLYSIFNEVLADYEIHILLGNHDTYYKSSIDTHSLVFLKKSEHIKLYEKTKTIEIFNKKILLMPWQVDDKFQNEKYDADIFMSHLDVSGFRLNKYVISDDGIKTTFFKQFDRTYLGHFHTRSKKVLENGSIIEYIGSPYHLTRNDSGDERGFTILDLDNYNEEFVPVNNTIKYLKYYYPELPKPEEVKNNIIDIHVKIDSAFKENELNKKIRELELLEPLNINIFPIYNFDEVELDESGDYESMTFDKMISNYIKKLKGKISDKLISSIESEISLLKERLKTDE